MRRRRGNGEGSIFQRADGHWAATITVGYNGEGKRVRRTVYGATKREVQEKLAKLQTQKIDGTIGEATKQSVGEFLTNWLEHTARPQIRPATYWVYEGLIRNHIQPHVGGIRLAKLTPQHVQGMYSAMERGGASGKMRQHVHGVLRKALGQAVKWDMLPRNVCGVVDAPRAAKPTMQALSPQQVGQFLRAAESDRLYALYVLAITTGMRQGELFALHWQDVDLNAKRVVVKHTLSEVRGKLWLAEPKTAKSRRTVQLTQTAVDALHEHRKRMLAEGHAGNDLVFCNQEGGLMRKSNVRRRSFEPLLKAAGLPRIRFHDLRHTAATLLLGQGTHPKLVQEQLGHANIAITLDTYSHVLPSMHHEAAAKMDALLASCAG